MKIYVSPVVIAGTQRGGEDLQFCYRAEHCGENPPTDEEVEVVLYCAEDHEDLSVQILEDIEEIEDDEYADVRVRYTTNYYEFTWEGKGEDALKTGPILEHFKNPENWAYCHKPGQPARLRCERTELIEGNAE